MRFSGKLKVEARKTFIRVEGPTLKARRPKVIAVVMAIHFPQALAMVLLTVLLGYVFGVEDYALLYLLLAAASGQAFTGWSNDYIDADLDKSLGRETKPVVRDQLQKSDLVIPMIASLVVVFPTSFLAGGLIGGLAHLVAVASAFVYNRYLCRTSFSWLPYAVSFGAFPLFIAQTTSRDFCPTTGLFVICALIGVVIHLLNALPDIEIDRKAGLGGVAVSLGKRNSLVWAGFIVVLVLAITSFELNQVSFFEE
jgi:4-hydroxybenzoate polyprenyltransferase